MLFCSECRWWTRNPKMTEVGRCRYPLPEWVRMNHHVGHATYARDGSKCEVRAPVARALEAQGETQTAATGK